MPFPAKPPDSHSGSNYYFCIWGGLRKCYARKQHRERVNKDRVMGFAPAHSQEKNGDPPAHVHGDCYARLDRDKEEPQIGRFTGQQDQCGTDQELTWGGCREEPCGNKPPRRASAA